ncbi:MAG: carboxylating nicotinate-nucleotide diphosphorylase [Myxococcales bacterium]|nr:MAG: carboxylating nicotinate-nucleotide diphosphorylase [Myxococcales bacterium]
MTGERLPLSDYEAIVNLALAEDIGPGDVTTRACIPVEKRAVARLVAKSDHVLCGIEVAKTIFNKLDPECTFSVGRADGESIPAGETLLVVSGNAAALLMAERTALNFLQRLSGTATLARQFVAATAGTKARILDTRKTTPGLRILQKYAVRCGGAFNHRAGLFDGVLIKENHIRAAGGIAKAIAACRANCHHLIAVEVEVATLDELDEALAAGAMIVLLDNFPPQQAAQAAARVNGRVKLEVSGGVTLENVRAYAEAGVDLISIGRLTHSAPAADISMLFDREIWG